MMFTKVKIAAAMLLTMAAFAVGAGLLRRQIGEASGAASAPREIELRALTQPRSPAAKPAEDKPQVPLDRFGDRLPEGAVARLGTVRSRHGAEVRSVAFSPNGKTLASGGQDNAVRFWEITTGKETRRFTAVTGLGAEHAWVSSIAYSPDGKLLAAGTMNGPGEVVIWELASGKESRPLRLNRAGVVCLAYSLDGKILAAGTQDGLIHLWDAATGKLLRHLKGHQGWIESIAFAPDAKSLASACRDKTVRLWDPASGRELLQLKGHDNMVTAVAFAPDGKTLASGSWDNTIRLWDTTTGQELHLLRGHEGDVSTIAYLPDGKTLVSGSWDWSIRLWDTGSGLERRPIHRCWSVVTSIAVSPDGQTLASGSWDRIVRLLDIATGKERRPTEGNRSRLWAVAISPDGKRVVTGGEEGVVRIWDADAGKEILRLIDPRPILPPVGGGTLRMTIGDHLQFTTDGKTVNVPIAGVLSRWNAETGKEIQHKDYQPAHGLYFTPDDKFVIGQDGENFRVMDAATGKQIRQFKASQRNFISTVSADSKFLACGSPKEDGTVVIWELATGKERCRCRGVPQIPYALRFSPDDKYLAGTFANFQVHIPETTIYVWETDSGREVRQFRARGHYINCLAYSADGRMLASGGGDKTVRLWETATGKERQSFKGHQGNVNSTAFSSDGTRLVSASDDTTALVWDATAPAPAGNPTAEQLQDAWNDLASDDAAKAYRAIWLLARNPQQSVPLLREHVRPAHALDAETSKQIERWRMDLDSDKADVREHASAELEKRVATAEPILRKALTGQPSLEQRKRIEQVLERLEREQLVLGRTIEALEHTEAPESQQLLEKLAAGEPAAWLTHEAKAALARLVRKPT